MSKIPAIDAKKIQDLESGARNRAAFQDNELAALVEEFEEFGDVAVSPSFKSLKSDTKKAGGASRDADRLSTPSVMQTAQVNTAKRELDNKQESVLPAATLGKTPSKSVYRITTKPSTDPLAIPSNKKEGMPDGAKGPGLSSAVAATPKKRNRKRGIAVAAVALVTAAGAGYLYVQSTQTASSETVVYSVPVFDDAADTTVQDMQQKPVEAEIVDRQMDVAEYSPPSTALPTSVTPVASKPLGFNDSLSDEFPALEGQSLLDLATGVPAYAPSEIVPESEWQDVSCGGCHSFNQADLCKQGAYYFNHDKERMARIQHPYGGGFKQTLMDWAEGGCN